MKRVLLAALALLLPGTSLAEDLTGGRLAVFLDREGTAKDLAIAMFFRNPEIVAPLPDPRVQASSVRFVSNTADSCHVPLDPSRWRRRGSGFVYRFPAWRNPPGGISKVVFRPGRSGGQLVVEARGDGYGVNATSGPITTMQTQFSVGATSYVGKFQAAVGEAIHNTTETMVLAASGPPAPFNPGHEFLDFNGFPNIVVWGTQDLTIEEYDALTPPAGWVRNQPREGVGQSGRFLRSPDADTDGEFTRQEMFGVSWLHQATVVRIDGFLDPERRLSGSTVQKHHELTWCAGSQIAVLTSPEDLRYVLVSRDARRTSDTPTLPAGWTLETVPVDEDLDIRLPLHTTVIRGDNQDSFQGPLPADLDL